MNLAFAAVTLAAVSLPGFLFWYAYRLDERRCSGYRRPFTPSIIPCLITTAILHAAWLQVSDVVGTRTVNYPVVVAVLTGAMDEASSLYQPENAIGNEPKADNGQVLLEALTTSLAQIVLYLATLYITSFLLGFILWAIVRALNWKWLTTLPLLSFNQWYVLFRLRFTDERIDRKLINLVGEDVLIAAMVETANANYLYAGYLDRFSLGEDGTLKSITLFDAARRIISSDCNEELASSAGAKIQKTFDDKFYPIDGDFFVIRVDDVKNLLIKYMYWVEGPAPKGALELDDNASETKGSDSSSEETQ